MTTLQAILNSVAALDAADKQVLRDMLNAQLDAPREPRAGNNGSAQAHPLVGLLSDDTELADEILASAMHARETRPLRSEP